nr:hypothetical protein [Tanacetum cinerariifolium]
MKDTLSSCSNLEAQQMQQIQDKAKKSCMVSFRQLHSHLKRLSQNDFQGSRTESGFKRAFARLSSQDTKTSIGTMFLNVEQPKKQLDKEYFQEIGSMATFNVLETHFQMFITNRDYLNDEYVAMTRNYFIQYTQQAIPEFHDTLIQHLEFVKKSIDERVQLKREYDSWDTSSRSGNDAHDDDTDIRPIYDEETMAEVQMTAKIDVFAIGQEHTEQPEFNNEGEVVQNAKECHDTWKSMLQSHRNQSVVRQPIAFKSERPRISNPRCDSQVDVHNDLSKPVTTHYLPKEREAASAKPHHMITSRNSRISSNNMPRFTSNDMIHNHYLDEAKKKTQECSRNSEPSLMPLLDHKAQLMTCLMPLAIKTHNDSFIFVHELKQEMHADLKYVESLEKEIDELKSDKAEFSNMYDVILQEYVSNDVMCSYMLSLSDLDTLDELQCLYLHKVKECDCLAQKLSKQAASVSKKVHTELLKRFAKVEKHSISLEIDLKECKE